MNKLIPRVVLGIILSLGLMASLPSQANPVTFVVKGSVTGFDGPQIDPFEVGQPYEAYYTFETETVGDPVFGGGFDYPALISATFKIGDYEGSLGSTTGSLINVVTRSVSYTYSVVLDDIQGDPILTPAGEIVPPSQLNLISLVIFTPPLPTEELPSNPLPLSDVGQDDWSLTFQSNEFLGAVRGDISTFETAQVFPYIGDPIPGIILNTELAPGSGGSAGVIQTGGLTPGVEAFVDRSGQQWQTIPAQMIGADFIQTAQDNADYPYIGIDVSVASGTILHMLVPENDDLLPFEWMTEAVFGADWANTGAIVVTSWSSPAQVWSTVTPLPAGTYQFRELPNDRSFYGIAATRAGVSVLIDIKPGSDSNPINCQSRGVIPVAVLGATDFDVTQIDVLTIMFGPGEASPSHIVRFNDVNRDGFVDVVFRFKTQDVDLNFGDTGATLTGATFDGQLFSGTATVTALHCGKLIASFADDMRGGGLPHASNSSAGAWIYGWNSVGAVGDPAGLFSWLLSTDDTVFLHDTDGAAGLPDAPPGAFTYMGWVDTDQTTAGGHPGQGFEQNEFERFVMALFVLPEDGFFEIQNSIVQLVNSQGNSENSDGLSYFVTVLGEEPSTVGLVEPGYLNSGSFDTDLGYHTAGQFVVVGVGSRGNDNFDTFGMDFDIVAVRNHRHCH